MTHANMNNTIKISWHILWLSMLGCYPCLGQRLVPAASTLNPGIVAGLKVGDTLPDLFIAKLINHRGKSLRTGDFSDRLLILDFWATTCGSCVVEIPKLAKVQRQFGSKIKILPVTPEKKELVQAFWKSNNHLNKLDLPVVVEDTLLSKYIRHRFISHEAWVYKGKIVAITGPEYVDSSTVSKVLSGAKINFPLKYDYYNFNFDAPLFTLDTTQIDPQHTSVTYAALSGYRQGMSSEGMGGMGIKRDTLRRSVRVYIANSSVYSAYIFLYNRVGLMPRTAQGFSPNQVVWEVGNRDQYQWRGKKLSSYQQDWEALHSFCYESVRPDTGQSDRQVYLQAMVDLEGLLGINVRWQRRRENVYVLKTDALAKTKILTEGLSTLSLVGGMNQNESSSYVLDESGGGLKVPKAFINFRDTDSLALAIAPYGLRLEQQQRDVDKLVFTETSAMLPDGKLTGEYQKRKVLQAGLKNTEPSENILFLDRNTKVPNVVTLPSGLQYKILQEGKGRSPLETDMVKLHYTGMQVNGKIFESTLEGGTARVVKVSEMIPGWIEALQLMREGSKWMLYIPASLAYGDHTAHGRFPKNSTLIFELELLQVVQPAGK
jgi:FKBP-type peptidyl-prolyl cis-trans isomerase/thiol-disulfide isomerase/thioredoxin